MAKPPRCKPGCDDSRVLEIKPGGRGAGAGPITIRLRTSSPLLRRRSHPNDIPTALVVRHHKFCRACLRNGNCDGTAEEVRFELTGPLRAHRFSRPAHSATLPLLRATKEQ